MFFYSFRIMRLVLAGLLLFILSACNNQPVTTVTETEVVFPTETSNLSQTIPPTEDIETTHNVTIYLIALEDNGQSGKKIGCDDSLIPVVVTSSSDQDSPWDAVQSLLDLKDNYFGESGLYNALYQSNLSLESYQVDGRKAKVYLEGEMMLGGVCDNPRVEEQILSTILQDGLFDDVEVYVNGELLQDVLSLK